MENISEYIIGEKIHAYNENRAEIFEKGIEFETNSLALLHYSERLFALNETFDGSIEKQSQLYRISGKLEEIIPGITKLIFDEAGAFELQEEAVEKLIKSYEQLEYKNSRIMIHDELMNQAFGIKAQMNLEYGGLDYDGYEGLLKRIEALKQEIADVPMEDPFLTKQKKFNLPFGFSFGGYTAEALLAQENNEFYVNQVAEKREKISFYEGLLDFYENINHDIRSSDEMLDIHFLESMLMQPTPINTQPIIPQVTVHVHVAQVNDRIDVEMMARMIVDRVSDGVSKFRNSDLTIPY